MNKKENLLTIKELKEELNKLDSSYDDNIVVLSRDPEGNDCRVINKDAYMSTMYKFIPQECGWCGTIYIRNITTELRSYGYSEDHIPEGSLDCVVIYPYN